MAKTNYVTREGLLNEINKSKATFSSFIDDKYQDFDSIIAKPSDAFINVELARKSRASRINAAIREANPTLKYHQVAKLYTTEEDIPLEDLCFRVMTKDHIPAGEKPTNFAPYKHYAIIGGATQEVGRSHWIGGLGNGYYSESHGHLTNGLANMLMLIVKRYGLRGNWRGYSYNEDMCGTALVQLCAGALKFDESRTNNPFGYYSKTIENSFTKVHNLEDRVQNIRDDLVEQYGKSPSHSRQLRNEGW